MSQNRIELLQKAIHDNPNDPFPYFGLAKSYEKAGEIDKALQQYDYLIQNHSDYGGTYYHYVILLLDLDEWDKAEKVCDQGLEVLLEQNEQQLYNELLMLKEQNL